MKYLLDTNVCVRYLNGESDLLRRRLQRTNLEDIAVCSVVKMELFYGAMRSNNPDVSWRK
nr:type II toxin-antitoxin system VapC family toxin [Brasilonema sennae]